jgi:glucose-6-phosphate 1-epimerase
VYEQRYLDFSRLPESSNSIIIVMPVVSQTDKIILEHPKGSSAEILLYGATVISWKASSASDSQPVERLFVSSKALLDGSKPVRGGIPIVFPAFGAPVHPQHQRLDQHGFARNNPWQFESTIMDNEAGVSVRLSLKSTPVIKAIFDQPFELGYVVTLAEHQLSTDLHIKNTSSEPLPFQALFHNYIQAPSDQALITPLTGLKYTDKTVSGEPGQNVLKTEERLAVDVRHHTDSVYEDAPQKYQITWPGDGIEIKTNLKDVVIWNPQVEAGSKIGDMEAGGWEKYVCVEPGHVRGFRELPAGESWIAQQVLTVISPKL